MHRTAPSFSLAKTARRSAVTRTCGRSPLVVRAIAAPPVPGTFDQTPSQRRKQEEVEEAEGCPVFITKEGRIIKAMCADYGFRSGSGRLYQEHYGEVPKNVGELARDNFSKELLQMRRAFRYGTPVDPHVNDGLAQQTRHRINNAIVGFFAGLDVWLEERGVLSELKPLPTKSALLTSEFQEVQAKLAQLKLPTSAVLEYEAKRVAVMGELETPWVIKLPFLALCWVLDVVYDNKPIPKFWVLEVVARIPYFSYITVLHLYESIGFWRAGAELRRIHFAEEWNEMHHLQIMESLGGDMSWFDRFLAEHAAIAYYWLILGFYFASPKLAYNFMQRVELHAADTYSAFVLENKEVLSEIAPPIVALDYYLASDLYLFDAFQTGNVDKAKPRRPKCESLLDVFENIRQDEMEHVATMKACQEATISSAYAAARGKEGARDLPPGADSPSEKP